MGTPASGAPLAEMTTSRRLSTCQSVVAEWFIVRPMGRVSPSTWDLNSTRFKNRRPHLSISLYRLRLLADKRPECNGSAQRSVRIFYVIDTIILQLDLSMILICWGCFMKTTLPRQDISSSPFLLSKSSELPEATMSLNARLVFGMPTALMYLATDWLL
jgi:hypothetical protein